MMSMPVLVFLFVLSLGLIAVAFMSDGSDKNTTRRLADVRERHGVTTAGESQVRRITANQDTALDKWFRQFIPNTEMLRRRLEATGRDWTLGRFSLICCGIVAAVWLLLLLRGFPLLLTLFLGVLAGIGIPYFVIGRMGKKRVAKFVTTFPDAIELLVRGLRSGLPISETIGVVANELPGPVGVEFRTVTDKMKIGRTMEGALQDTADKLATPEFQFFVITLAIQRETGGNLAETLANLADVLRKRMQMKLKVKAMSSESKASAWIIGVLPFIVFGMIMYINPPYMLGFFHDQRLMIAGGGGLIWMGVGVFIMSRMINFEI